MGSAFETINVPAFDLATKQSLRQRASRCQVMQRNRMDGSYKGRPGGLSIRLKDLEMY